MKPPIWNSENEAGCSVSQSASEAEIFIGCRSVVTIPKLLPNHEVEGRHGHQHDQRELRGAQEQVALAAAHELPAGDAEHDHGRRGHAGEDRVAEGPEREACS